MAIDVQTVQRVAHLARIALPADRAPAMAQELSRILAWVEQLQEVDVAGVAPMASAVPDLKLHMREDAVTEGGDAGRVLANAPKSEDGFFVVPKVVE